MKSVNPAERASSLSFRQLRPFESVGRLNSVRKAADECGLSQPAVTQALAKLEREVGVSLLERRASGSYLNGPGRIFHRRAARLFAQIEEALGELDIPGGAAAIPAAARQISRSQIRGLVAIVENCSFARAARVLGLSQASLQRAARTLENRLRKPLFHRLAAGMMVTPAAREFGRRMKLAAQEIEWGLTEIEGDRGTCDGTIVIGAVPAAGCVLLASALDDFIAVYPTADVRIISGNGAEMLNGLRSGAVDFIVGLLQQPSDGVTAEPLAKAPYAIVSRHGHRLLRGGRVTIEDLLAQDWVIDRDDAHRLACFEGLFAGHGRPRAAISTSSQPLVPLLLARSDRLALLTSYELAREDDALAALPFGTIEPVPQVGMTTRTDWLPTRLHVAFMDLLRQRIADADIVRPMLRRVG